MPLDRGFGIDVAMVDSPTPVAQAKLTASLVVAVHKYEPRATVKRVTYTGDADGRLVAESEPAKFCGQTSMYGPQTERGAATLATPAPDLIAQFASPASLIAPL